MNLGSPIFVFSNFEISDFLEIMLGKYGFEISKKTIKRFSGETLDKTEGFEDYF